MRARFLGIGLSILLSLASIGLFIHPGLSYGIDFKGGIQMEVQTPGAADLGQLRSQLGGLGLGEVTLQGIGDEHGVLIRVERQEGGEQAQTAAVQTMRQAIAEAAPGASIERTEVVGRRSAASWRKPAFSPSRSPASPCSATSGSASSGTSPSARSPRWCSIRRRWSGSSP
jgi:preprotein translocase subunit SecF